MGGAPGTGSDADAQAATNRYVALLRGVNVGGRSVPMGELRELVRGLGHADVTTYIQSGNVLFATPRDDAAGLADELRGAIAAELGHHVTVILRTPSDLERVLAHNPYAARGEPSRLYVTFLDGAPDPALVAGLDAAAGGADQFSIRRHEVYVWCPTGYGRTVVSNEFFERRLKLAATTRNWRTVTRLAKLARG